MTKKTLSKQAKANRIVVPARSGAARAQATREATRMLPKKSPVNATRLTRGK